MIQALESMKDEKIGLAGGIGFGPSEHNGVSKVTVLQARNGQVHRESGMTGITSGRRDAWHS